MDNSTPKRVGYKKKGEIVTETREERENVGKMDKKKDAFEKVCVGGVFCLSEIVKPNPAE